MNYRHAYHAGSLADLIKHITLAHLLARLCTKETPFCVMDTHAGAGSYDLRAPEAQKTGEAATGVFRFAKLSETEALAPLQAVLKKWNLGIALGEGFDPARLGFYPGSPAVIRHYLRATDRLIAVEKHPEEMAKLRKLVGFESNVQLHERDGFEAMGALLPPPEKRLLVFIDPAFEQHDEMDKSAKAIIKAWPRNTTAMFALWYPLVDDIAIAQMKEALVAGPMQKILCAEAEYAPQANMRGCGLMLINPPWQIENALSDMLKILRPLFAENAPAAQIEWLKSGE
jgi:23S rRNA (adenine2030-N6)-methyltransferase